MVVKRHVFFLAGFDPYDIAGLYRRFRREADTFQKTWNVSATVSDLKQPDAVTGHWLVSTKGPNWATDVTYEPLAWHDIVIADVAGPTLPRLRDGAATLWDFIRSGTMTRYLRSNWRYALFFLVPFANVVLFAAIGIAVGCWVALRLPVPPALAVIVGVAVAVALFPLLLWWPGRRWRVSQGLADWITPRTYMYGRHSEMAARIDAFNERLLACIRRNEADEILIIGHSLGAILAVDVLARALAADPQLGRRGPAVCFLTIGATIPKLTLHPAATRLRACAERVAAEDSIAWGEFQTRKDPISFFSFDPVRLRPFTENTGNKPHIRLINFWDVLDAAKMRRINSDFMRIHYQFVMAAQRRAVYDFFMLVCGPAPFANAIWAPGGCAELIDADGRYLAAPAPARRTATDAS